MNEYMGNLKTGDSIEILYLPSHAYRGYRKLKGRIVGIYKNFITVRHKNYNTCYGYYDFKAGYAMLVKEKYLC